MTSRPGGEKGPVRPPAKGGQGVLSGGDAAAAGIQFTLTMLVFVFAGIWIDRKLDSSPWFTIGMLFVGAAGAFFSIYRKLMAAQRRDDARRGR